MAKNTTEIVEINIRVQLNNVDKLQASLLRAYLNECFTNDTPINESQMLEFLPAFSLYLSGNPVCNAGVTNIHITQEKPLPF